MDLGLNGKVALTTGANRGIGATIAIELAKEGVPVCMVARGPAKLDDVAAVHAADLRKPAVAVASVRITIDAFGNLDILANHAGAPKRDSFFTTAEGDFHDGFALKSDDFVGTTHVGRRDEIGAMTAFLASARGDYLQRSIIDGGVTRTL